MSRIVSYEEFLYPKFNTLRMDGKTLDGRPYQKGMNLPGLPIPQYYWDTQNDCNFREPAYVIEPCARLVPSKQRQFYELIFKEKEVFQAGSRGTAKTTALLKSHVLKRMSWKVRGITGQNTAMFSRTKDSLIERHVSEFPNVYPSWVGTFDSTHMRFNFSEKIGGGSMFLLYAGQRDEQIRRLLSLNLPFVTFEELTELSEFQYLWVLSSMRSTQVPEDEWCAASASNSGGKGHKWVANRFINPRIREDANKRGEGRALIKLFPYENPHLPKEYWDKQLAKLTPKWRKAWIDNDWGAYEGQYFDMISDEIHFLPPRSMRDEIPKYGAIDHGAGAHPTGAVFAERYKQTEEHPKGKIIVGLYYEHKDKFSSNHKRNIWRMLGYNEDGSPIVKGKEVKNIQFPLFLSHDAFSTKGATEGDLTVSERYNENDKFGKSLDCIPSKKNPGIRAIGWQAVADLLAYESHVEERFEEQPDGSMRRIVELKIDRPPHLYFLDTPEIRQGVEELTRMIHDPDNPGDAIRTGSNDYEEFEGDEFPDALRMLVMGMGAGDVFYEQEEEEIVYPRYNPFKEMMKRENYGGSITMGDFFS